MRELLILGTSNFTFGLRTGSHRLRRPLGECCFGTVLLVCIIMVWLRALRALPVSVSVSVSVSASVSESLSAWVWLPWQVVFLDLLACGEHPII